MTCCDTFFLPLIQEGEDKTHPLKNRIRKNYKHLRKWAKRSQTNCFRIYDRDIKEYPLAIDFYAGRFCVHYFSDRENVERAAELKKEVDVILCSLFELNPHQIFDRTRIRRQKIEQYEKRGEEKNFFLVQEYGAFFQINLEDYLDTGLFLDHRETRKKVAEAAKDKHLLNLFSYTCSFSVHAALAGALSTTSVDLSNTYCNWGVENFKANSISLKNHTIIREDCLKFLHQDRNRYDLIVIDPPTLSRSKKMTQLFDIQKDYPTLIQRALLLLNEGGKIFFSTNARKFHLDQSLLSLCILKEISDKTIPLDFHDKKMHRCWEITR